MSSIREQLLTKYPAGTRIKLTAPLKDAYSKLKAGDIGTVRMIDDMGNIHMRWDTGSSLALIEGVDSFCVLPNEPN